MVPNGSGAAMSGLRGKARRPVSDNPQPTPADREGRETDLRLLGATVNQVLDLTELKVQSASSKGTE